MPRSLDRGLQWRGEGPNHDIHGDFAVTTGGSQ